jgi:hypothetical protein
MNHPALPHARRRVVDRPSEPRGRLRRLAPQHPVNLHSPLFRNCPRVVTQLHFVQDLLPGSSVAQGVAYRQELSEERSVGTADVPRATE